MSAECELVTRPKGGRRYRTVEEKRRIVEEALRPEASVSAVARQHGVNTNLLFTWRSLYLGGHLKPSHPSESVPEARLLPVSVSNEAMQNPGPSPSSTSSNITINIELPGSTLVSLEGQVSAEIVRAVLESLRR